jgi:hypothetical protein
LFGRYQVHVGLELFLGEHPRTDVKYIEVEIKNWNGRAKIISRQDLDQRCREGITVTYPATGLERYMDRVIDMVLEEPPSSSPQLMIATSPRNQTLSPPSITLCHS